jgi:glyoxylase-like metal-dependent hydrolase (beta-lactamase superfamily II)
MLGNSYWADLGVPIVAHADAAHEFDKTAFNILEGMKGYNRDKAEGTRAQGPTQTFEDSYTIEMGDMTIEILHLGPAHSPGDISVWLPAQKLVIAGDIAFHERMEPLGALYVIPGHGHPTNMTQVRRYTHDYLVDIREKIGAHLEAGGGLADAYYIDQSEWARLDTFEELATKNAGRVYEEMEFE